MNLPKTNKPRIVIIGGGFAGMNLAKNLRGANAQVVLVDKNNFHTFQPLLYQVATAGLEPDSVTYPLRKIFNKYNDFYFRIAVAQEIDTEREVLITDRGEIAYDYLVLSTGAETNFIVVQGGEYIGVGHVSEITIFDGHVGIVIGIHVAEVNAYLGAAQLQLTDHPV